MDTAISQFDLPYDFYGGYKSPNISFRCDGYVEYAYEVAFGETGATVNGGIFPDDHDWLLDLSPAGQMTYINSHYDDIFLPSTKQTQFNNYGRDASRETGRPSVSFTSGPSGWQSSDGPHTFFASGTDSYTPDSYIWVRYKLTKGSTDYGWTTWSKGSGHYWDGLSDGSYTVYAESSDQDGNTCSTAASRSFGVDTTVPQNPNSPASESHGVQDNVAQSSVSDPAFSWTGASDSDSGVKGYYWYFGTSSSGNPNNWTTSAGCDPSSVSYGTYYLRVKTEDNVGNQSAAQTLFVFRYTAAPTRIIRLDGDLAFGSVQVGSSAQRTLTIYNDGNSTLSVSSISYPSGFSGSWSGTIGAGSSHDVTVTFSPSSATTYSGNVSVSSDATSGTNTRSISGTGTPVTTRIIRLDGDLSFGNVQVGSSAQRTLTIYNDGNATLSVSGISYPSGFSGNWSGTIGAGSSHGVTVTFSPSNATAYSGNVSVSSDATSGTNNKSVSGTGTTGIPPALSVTPIIQSLGYAAGTTTFAVANSGGGTISYTASESESWLSILSGGSGGNSGTITVSFNANSATTARTGTITVTASGANGSPKNVIVTQAGTNSAINLPWLKLLLKHGN